MAGGARLRGQPAQRPSAASLPRVAAGAGGLAGPSLVYSFYSESNEKALESLSRWCGFVFQWDHSGRFVLFCLRKIKGKSRNREIDHRSVQEREGAGSGAAVRSFCLCVFSILF